MSAVQKHKLKLAVNVPFEIQEDIIKRVAAVKSLLRFRSVSKRWKSLIHSSVFIAHHHHLVNHPENMLVRYKVDREFKYVSLVDDDSFPKQKFSPVTTPSVNLVETSIIFESSQKLVCLYGYVAGGYSPVVLWNPSIGKSVTIKLLRRSRVIGFGVCPKTLDPKIIKSTSLNDIHPAEWPVELFTLSSGAFRRISHSGRLPPRCITFAQDQKVIDGVIYWCNADRQNNVIVTFDLTHEEFGGVKLPYNLKDKNLKISKVKESLAVLEIYENEYVCHVWMLMKNGLTKLFTVSLAADGFDPMHIIGFRKNGEVLRTNVRGNDGSSATLKAYDPSTKHSTDLGTPIASDKIDPYSYRPTTYSESLLLLNHSNTIFWG